MHNAAVWSVDPVRKTRGDNPCPWLSFPPPGLVPMRPFNPWRPFVLIQDRIAAASQSCCFVRRRARRSNADERVCTVRPILALEGWHRDNFLECKAEAALCLVHMVDDERLVLLLAREASYHRIHLVRYRAQPAQPAAWRRITTSGALCSIWRTTTRLDQFSLHGCTSDSAGDAILQCRGEDFTAPIETDTKQAVSVIKRSELKSSSSGIVMVNQRNLRRL